MDLINSSDENSIKGDLSGMSTGPVLISNMGTVDISSGSYKLLLTGYDVPKINAGEHLQLYNYDRNDNKYT